MAGSEASAAFAEGVPCWIDAQLPDVEAGKRFYGGLFGWTFEPFEGVREADSPYAAAVRADLDGDAVAALVPKRDGRMPTVWTVYFATPDAPDLADRIRKAGGQIITAPVPVGPYGTAGLAADSEGAVFGLWEGGTHPGFGRGHRTGAFGWTELYARDTATADAFYPGLFRDALFGPGTIRSFGRAHISDVFPAEMPPHFLVHFDVADCEAELGTVTRLGGRVQVPPFGTSYGRVAVVSDNQGASFALLQR
ncbi:VOC family protein [Streptomyces sp. Qhu-G9]|uniref:VOC family protein n=1 Tax=Streptomyces sp. Qhu-G9 TaxID=3452799 RepID=UPI0022AC798B|nr:VOC family protein [Streptomyces aurantiacus]WAU85637.1 VOC family protein [Streptomyces aurantiacus]